MARSARVRIYPDTIPHGCFENFSQSLSNFIYHLIWFNNNAELTKLRKTLSMTKVFAYRRSLIINDCNS